MGVRTPGESRVGYALFAVCAVAVLAASVVPPPAAVAGPVVRPLGIPADKWVHAGAYAALAALLCFAARVRTAQAVVLVTAVVVAYGLGIEFLQATLPARTFDLADAAANAAGAALAALAWRVGVGCDRR